MKKPLILIAFLVAFISTPVIAQDTSPYVVGHWKVADSFHDFTSGEPLVTDNTDFSFLNPTDLTLTLEYAFLRPMGHFAAVIAIL